MKLKKFVVETMKDLDDSIKESSSVIGIRGTVHFDVAVIANEETGINGGIQVIGIAKASSNTSISNQTVTRLQFDIQTKRAINPNQSNPYNPKKK